MEKPLLGVPVLFHCTGGHWGSHKCPCVAIVTDVLADDCVNLCVFDNHGVPHSVTCVPFVQPDKKPPADFTYCTPASSVKRNDQRKVLGAGRHEKPKPPKEPEKPAEEKPAVTAESEPKEPPPAAEGDPCPEPEPAAE